MARMVSLARTDADHQTELATAMARPSGPDVPAGLCLCLTDRELELLDLDDEGVEDGDLLHLRVMVQVTAVHKENGATRIEAAIIAGRAEDESTEGDDPAEPDEA